MIAIKIKHPKNEEDWILFQYQNGKLTSEDTIQKLYWLTKKNHLPKYEIPVVQTPETR